MSTVAETNGTIPQIKPIPRIGDAAPNFNAVTTVEALQTADANSAALPVNWRPGDKVIVPPPKTLAEVEERLASNYERIDFYLAKKDLV